MAQLYFILKQSSKFLCSTAIEKSSIHDDDYDVPSAALQIKLQKIYIHRREVFRIHFVKNGELSPNIFSRIAICRGKRTKIYVVLLSR